MTLEEWWDDVHAAYRGVLMQLPWLPADLDIRAATSPLEHFRFDDPAHFWLEIFPMADSRVMWHGSGHVAVHVASLAREAVTHNGKGGVEIREEFCALLSLPRDLRMEAVGQYGELDEWMADAFALAYGMPTYYPAPPGGVTPPTPALRAFFATLNVPSGRNAPIVPLAEVIPSTKPNLGNPPSLSVPPPLPSASPSSAGVRGVSPVVDYYSAKESDFERCARAEGVWGIARYLTNSPGDIRQTTLAEVAAAHDAGLAVHFVYEMNPTYPEYFTFAQGAEDCRQAVERLRELGAPAGTIVYFAVDANIEPSITDEYFNGVESMATPQITPGVYGFERMVEHARASYPHIGQHLWQTYGVRNGPLDLWQHEQRSMCGVDVDINECTVAGWPPKEDSMVSREEFTAYKGNVLDSFTAHVNAIADLSDRLKKVEADDTVDDTTVATLRASLEQLRATLHTA